MAVVSVVGASAAVTGCFLTRDGNGGGGISEEVCAGSRDAIPCPVLPLSLDSGGDANRAVGRRVDVDGVRDFFRMGCGGGGREDEGVGGLLLIGAVSCPELSPGRLIASSRLCRLEPRVSRPVSKRTSWYRAGDTYFGVLAVFYWRPEWRISWTIRQLLKEPGKGGPAQVSFVASPYMPPEVLQAICTRVKTSSKSCRIN